MRAVNRGTRRTVHGPRHARMIVSIGVLRSDLPSPGPLTPSRPWGGRRPARTAVRPRARPPAKVPGRVRERDCRAEVRSPREVVLPGRHSPVPSRRPLRYHAALADREGTGGGSIRWDEDRPAERSPARGKAEGRAPGRRSDVGEGRRHGLRNGFAKPSWPIGSDGSPPPKRVTGRCSRHTPDSRAPP